MHRRRQVAHQKQLERQQPPHLQLRPSPRPHLPPPPHSQPQLERPVGSPCRPSPPSCLQRRPPVHPSPHHTTQVFRSQGQHLALRRRRRPPAAQPSSKLSLNQEHWRPPPAPAVVTAVPMSRRVLLQWCPPAAVAAAQGGCASTRRVRQPRLSTGGCRRLLPHDRRQRPPRVLHSTTRGPRWPPPRPPSHPCRPVASRLGVQPLDPKAPVAKVRVRRGGCSRKCRCSSGQVVRCPRG